MEVEVADMTETETMEISYCKKVVDLMQASFQEGWLAEEDTWKGVVLITKEGEDYNDIYLL